MFKNQIYLRTLRTGCKHHIYLIIRRPQIPFTVEILKINNLLLIHIKFLGTILWHKHDLFPFIFIIAHFKSTECF
jgi:hypothetical protein